MTRAFTRFLLLTACIIAASVVYNAHARSLRDECVLPQHNFLPNLIRCLDDVSRRLERESPNGAKRVELLLLRAEIYQMLGRNRGMTEPFASGPDFEAALADYDAAFAITPNDNIRTSRAYLLLSMNRNERALNDVEVLLQKHPKTIGYLKLKAKALTQLKRHQEAIAVYTEAIRMTQYCAEASAVQRLVNRYRRSFEPPPPPIVPQPLDENTVFAEVVPEPPIAALRLKCDASKANSFDDLASSKQGLLTDRGDVYRTIGNTKAAEADYEYALSLSEYSEFGSGRLCEFYVDMGSDWSAATHCRRSLGFNILLTSYPDPEKAAKIATFLLQDGELKGACRLVFEEFRDERERQAFHGNAKIKALQKRVRTAMDAAGMEKCENLRTPP